MKIMDFLRYVLLFVMVAIFVFPIYYMVDISLSSTSNILRGSLIPDWYLGNYYADKGECITKGDWILTIQHSLVNTSLSVVVTILLTFPAAFVFSRYHFMADKHIFFYFLATRMAPAAALLLPYLIMFRSVGLWDTIPGIVLAYCSFDVPLAIWLFTSFMGNIPKEIDEQAFIDGFTLWKYFRKIFIPACLPYIGVVAFFIWLFTWSEMFLASVLTSFGAKPVTVLLYVVLGRVGYSVQYGLAAAAGVVTIIPGMILLYWARTYLAKGFAFGRV